MLPAPLVDAVAFDRFEPGGPNTSADFFDWRASLPLRLVVFRGNRIDVVGTEGERNLRQLGAIQRPVDLNDIDVVCEEPRYGDALHIFVSGRRLRRVNFSRQ